MGGFVGNLFGGGGGGGGGGGNFEPAPPPQFTPTQYSNPQLIDFARSNNDNTDMLNQYNAELVRQLRENSYQNPYNVWQNVRTGQDKAAFDAANPQPQYIQPEEQYIQPEQFDPSQNWYNVG